MCLLKGLCRVVLIAAVLGVCVSAGIASAQDAAKADAAKHLSSTYDADGNTWLRGNIHTHSTESDGKKPPQEVVNFYAELGYDFLMISDHEKLTPVEGLDGKGMTLIPGSEISAKGPHLLHVGAKTHVLPDPDRQKVLDLIKQDGGISVMNHPNWQASYNHCSLEVLETLQGYTGVEIFNGVVVYLDGSELATDKWDRLLAKGRRIYGFATDDCHTPEQHAGMGWVMVQSKSRAMDDIVNAMRDGRFYASTGVAFEMINVDGLTVMVRAANAQRFRVCADNGKVLHMADGPEMQYTVKPGKGLTYIRIEGYGAGEQTAWLQPMFIE